MRNTHVGPVRRLLGLSGRLIATYVALLVASAVAGALLYRNAAPVPGFEPEAFQTALLAVTFLHALMICILAHQSRLGFWGTTAVVFALFFGVQTALTAAETLFFVSTGSLRFDPSNMPLDIASGCVTAIVGSMVAAWLFRGETGDAPSPELVSRLAMKLVGLSLFYPVVYWVAGLAIAMQSDAVVAFYGSSIDNIDPLGLLVFQIARGAVWAGLAWISVKALHGPRVQRAILIGMAFAVLMIAQLLYPNPIMPAPVRAVHAIELLVSNLLFGFVAAMVLSGKQKPD